MTEQPKKRSKWDISAEPTPGSTAKSTTIDPKQIAIQAALKIAAQTNTVAKELSHDIEIENASNRLLLTKSSTHHDIFSKTGASITVKGRYLPPEERSSRPPDEKPLHLHVQADTAEKVQKAVAMIEQMCKNQTPQSAKTGTLSRCVYVEMESLPGFNLFPRLLGKGGNYLQHISLQTGAKLFLKGKGSNRTATSDAEANEPLHFMITATSEQQMEEAVALTQSLIETTKKEYETFKANAANTQAQQQQAMYSHYPYYAAPAAGAAGGQAAAGYAYPQYAYPQYGYPYPMYYPGYAYPADPTQAQSSVVSDQAQPPTQSPSTNTDDAQTTPSKKQRLSDHALLTTELPPSPPSYNAEPPPPNLYSTK